MKNIYNFNLFIFFVALLLISCKDSKPNKTTNEITKHTEKSVESRKNEYSLYKYELSSQTIALSPLPGKTNLLEDIQKIKEAGIKDVVTLVDQKELDDNNLKDFFTQMKNSDINVYHSPITDFGLPREEQMDSILRHVQTQLDSGKNVLIHCMGGYGRSGTVMGCYARRYLNVEDPLEYVRNVRGESAIETEEQEAFVLEY